MQQDVAGYAANDPVAPINDFSSGYNGQQQQYGGAPPHQYGTPQQQQYGGGQQQQNQYGGQPQYGAPPV